MDIYFRSIEGKTKRTIATIVMLAAVLGMFNFIIAFDRVLFGISQVTIGRVIAVLLVLVVVWMNNPTKGF